MQDRFVKRLIASIKCAVCGQRYEVANINILGHQQDLWFLRVFCPGCRTQGLVAAVIKEERKGETLSELTPEERRHFFRSEPVSVDDMLDMHNFLKSFDGDFEELFKKTHR